MLRRKSSLRWIQYLCYPALIFICLASFGSQLFSQPLAQGKDKFLGCSAKSTFWSGLDQYFNQVTPGDAGKWGSVEATRDVYTWSGLDAIYNYTVQRGFPCKHHTLLWGSQQPSWLETLDSAQQREEVEEWIRDAGTRYPQMALIDVVNEPFHATPVYANALGGAGSTGWDWIVTAFTWARQYYPDAKLIINEYNIVHDDAVTTNYLRLIDTLAVRGLIDGIGVQGHYFEFRSELSNPPGGTYVYNITTIENNLQRLVDTGLPVYISEFDIDESNDTYQLQQYQIYFPIFWNNPGVKGITLWGYKQDDIWTAHPNSYLLLTDGTERPALAWLKTFVESGNFRSRQSGDWSDVNSWEQSDGSAWVPASHAPTTADYPIAILDAHTITVTAADSIDQVYVKAGGTLTVNPGISVMIKNGIGVDLTVSGSLSNSGSVLIEDSAAVRIESVGKYIHDQNGGTIPSLTWAAGSTCEVIGVTTNVPSNISQNFSNLTWNCISQNANLSLGWQNGTTIGGTLAVTSTNWNHSSFSNPSNHLLLFDGPGACTVNNIVVNGETAALVTQAGNFADTVYVNGNISMSAGGLLSLSDDNDGNALYYLNGNLSVSDSAYIGKSNPDNLSRLIFNRTGTQNINFPSSGVTFFGAPNAVVNSSSILNIGTSSFGGTGSFQLRSGATLQSGHINGVNGNITCSGAYGGGNLLSKAANYTFNGSVAQLTGNLMPDTVANLTLNNSTGLTLSGNVVVNCTMDMQLGLLSNGGHALSYGLNGTLKYSSNTSSQTSTDVEFPISGGPKNLVPSNTVFNVTLHASRVISGNLLLSSKLVVGANTITAGSVSTGNLTAMYVNTVGGGALRLPSVGATQVLFPVGTTTYAPVWITNNGVVDTISVGVVPEGTNSAPPRIRLKWNIKESTAGGGDYAIQFGWNSSGTTWENTPFKSDRAGNARIFWIDTASVPDDTMEAGSGSYTMQFFSSPYTVSRGGITELGPFLVGKFKDSVTTVINDNVEIPEKFSLNQNYPNPFNPATNIEYELPRSEFVTLKVYNMLGQLVATLVDGHQAAGKYTKIFDSRNMASGIYIYRLTAGANVMTKKMSLIK